MAEAHPNGSILLSLSIFDVLAKADLIISATPLGVHQGTLAVLSVVWVVAHEFFHLGRGHYAAREHGAAPEALEYDADCMAVAATFRFAQQSESLRVLFPSVLEMKRAVLRAFYWPARLAFRHSFYNQDSCNEHPAWFLRLHLMVFKLAWTNWCKLGELAARDGGWSPEMGPEIKVFGRDVLDMEMIYLGIFEAKESSRPPSPSDSTAIRFYNQLMDGERPDSRNLLALWMDAEPLVRKYQILGVFAVPPEGQAEPLLLREAEELRKRISAQSPLDAENI